MDRGQAGDRGQALGTLCCSGPHVGLALRSGITCAAFLSGHKSCNLLSVRLHWKCLSGSIGFIGVMLE